MSETQTMTIVEFLNARLDESEVLARAAARGEEDPGWVSGIHGTDGDVKTWRGDPVALYADADDVAAYPLDAHVAMFIGYNDPAHVLADIAAKREIIAAEMDRVGGRKGFVTAEIADRIRGRADSRVLRALASPYRDHPDWCDDWALTPA